MNKQDNKYFEQLSKHREKLADALEDPALSGVKSSVVDKYSDQAHFIYELLQNADDVEATYGRFVLYKDKLVFAHNGKRHFGISNPATEGEDGREGNLGDINGITSIANSSKNKDQNKIGKFGVGFKAVFQYTSTPYIYDPNIFFMIERFIVPKKINKDFQGRKPEETLFVFPFNHPERNEKEAYEDIFDKLRTLDYPMLFLSSLEKITFEVSGKSGSYDKSIVKDLQFDNTRAERIHLTRNDGDDIRQDDLWMFSRKDNKGYTYSTAFFLDEEEKLTARQHSAFCFFPTKETTNLNFIIHAPFLLTDSREGIRAGIQHNKDMIELLSDLAADSILYLRDIGNESGVQIINDDIFEIIPYDKSKFNDISDKNKISFMPFYTKILDKMKNEELLPATDGFVAGKNAYWANVPYIAKLFTNDQLAMLSGDESAKWVFRSFGRQDTLRKNKELTEYIDSIIYVCINEDDIINGCTITGNRNVIVGLKSDFIEAQSIEWLHSFYKWISETSKRTDSIKSKSIFLNQDRKAVAPFDSKGQAIIFISEDNESGYETVYPDLLKNKETAEFIKKLGITAPSLKDEIYNKILPKYENSDKINTMPHFKKFFKYYKECPHSEVKSFINMIKKYKFVLYRSDDNEQQYRDIAENLYFPNETLKKWFKAKTDTKFVSLDEYLQSVGMDNKDELIRFLTDLGVESEPRVLPHELSLQEALEITVNWSKSTCDRKWIEKYIDGSKELINYLIQEKNIELSVLVWKQLLQYVEYGYSCIHGILYGKYDYFYFSKRSKSFKSNEFTRLLTENWLVNRNGDFVSAHELTIETLSQYYNTNKDSASELLGYLGIDHEVDEIDDNLTDDQKGKIALAESLSDIPSEVLKRFAEEYRANKSTTIDLSGDCRGENSEEPQNSSVSRIVKEISKQVTSVQRTEVLSKNDKSENKVCFDEDDYVKPSVNFSEKIEQSKQRSASEIAEIAYLDELTNKAKNSKKYSFGWFKALLDLELLNSNENTSSSREVSIAFSRVEREEGTSRTLILKHPDRYIPQSMEDLADIPLELYFENQPMIKAIVEVVNVKSYTLRAKLRSKEQSTHGNKAIDK